MYMRTIRSYKLSTSHDICIVSSLWNNKYCCFYIYAVLTIWEPQFSFIFLLFNLKGQLLGWIKLLHYSRKYITVPQRAAENSGKCLVIVYHRGQVFCSQYNAVAVDLGQMVTKITCHFFRLCESFFFLVYGWLWLHWKGLYIIKYYFYVFNVFRFIGPFDIIDIIIVYLCLRMHLCIFYSYGAAVFYHGLCFQHYCAIIWFCFTVASCNVILSQLTCWKLTLPG